MSSQQEEATVLEYLKQIRKDLLNLSPRNRLLNFRSNKKSIQFLNDASNIYTNLVLNEKNLPIRSLPDLKKMFGIDDEDESQKKKDIEIALGLFCDSYGSSKDETPHLQSLLEAEALEGRLRKIRSDFDLAINETGLNLLHIALGFLKWRDVDQSERWYLAPLILIPVTIAKDKYVVDSDMYQYRISYEGEDLQKNISLAEKMRQDFGVAIPELWEAADEDNSDRKFNPSDYYKRVTKAISTRHGWEVVEYNYIAFFHFTKQRMYHDLDPEHWKSTEHGLLKHELIQDILLGKNVEPGQSVVPKEYDIDFSEDANNIPLVLDTDSSQHSVLIDALSDKNMVVQGPPGTGKSQTITNLICSAISAGKSILFMSEKMAALDVVMRNMKKVGLSDFCLELHRKKALKKSIMESLKKRRKANYENDSTITSKISQFTKERNELYKYLSAISEIISPINESVYSIIGKALNLQSLLGDSSNLEFKNVMALDQDAIDVRKNTLGKMNIHFGEYPNIGVCCWKGFVPERYVLGLEGEIKTDINDLINSFELSLKLMSRYNTTHKMKGGYCNFGLWRELSEINLDELPEIPIGFIQEISCLGSEDAQCLKNFIGNVKRARRLGNDLRAIISEHEELENLDFSSQKTYVIKLIEMVGETITCSQINTILSEMHALEKALLELKKYSDYFEFIEIHNLNTLGSFVRALDLSDHLKSCPESFMNNPDPSLLQDEAQICLEEERPRYEKLKRKKEYLEKIFALKDIANDLDFLKIRRILRKRRQNPFRFLFRDYREARTECLSILKDRKHLSQEIFVNELEKLEGFLEDKKRLDDVSRAKEFFGSHFQGFETDWEDLSHIIEWSTLFVEKSGSLDFAINFVNDIKQNLQNLPNTDELNSLMLKISNKRNVVIDFFKNRQFVDRYVVASNVSDIVLDDIINKYNITWLCISEQFDQLNIQLIKQDASLEHILKLIEMHEEYITLVKLVDNQEIKNILGPHFKGLDTSLENIQLTQQWIEKLKASKFPNSVVNSILESNVYEALKNIANLIPNINETCKSVQHLIDKLHGIGEFNFDVFFGSEFSKIEVQKLVEKLTKCVDNADLLQPWVKYNDLYKQSEHLGINVFVDFAVEGKIEPDNMAEYFEYSFYNSLAKEIINNNSILLDFDGGQYEKTRKSFAELDKQICLLTRDKLAASTSNAFIIPIGTSRGRASDFTECSLIDRECEKKKRHIPIRQLVKRAGRTIQALKPCFMMSPLSVAQFIEPGSLTFDMIIIDEASQLKPYDAIGALARGKQIVVVGDSKQLPPSYFFENIGDDDVTEDENPLQNVESILDACARVYTNSTRTLKWHYRSKHHNLISFSNSRYYNNELLVFPSPNTSDELQGIRYHYIVDACFYGGVKKFNPIEADSVANAIVSHALNHPKLSLGVATMNIHQKELIEEFLERITKDDSIARTAIDKISKLEDPLFIKNLENVQGDERDVIFISCTYGPDPESGRVLRRFGPINNPGGERRLNVLFSRAKYRMEVFTSMHSTDILADHTSSQGSRDLKDFLSYVESGKLPDHGTMTGREPDSDFEISVAREIMRLGFSVEYQLGVAGYFMDLAVYEPGSDTRFLLGIECDGATYHSSRSARDRDRLKEEVLRSRGWEIYRIWSTDWFKKKQVEVDKLKNLLSELASKVKSKKEKDETKDGTPGSFNDQQNGKLFTRDSLEDDTKDVYKEDHEEKTSPKKKSSDALTSSDLRKGILQVLLKRPNNTCAIKHMTKDVCKHFGIITRSGPRAVIEQRILVTIDKLVKENVLKKYWTSKNERIGLLSRFLAREILDN